MQISQFIASLLPTMASQTLVDDCRNLIGELDKTTIPAYTESLRLFKSWKFKSDTIKDYEKQYRQLTTHSGNMIVAIHDSLERILIIQKLIQDKIHDNFSHDIVAEGMTVVQANLIKATEMNTFISTFAMSFLNFVYAHEAVAIRDEATSNDFPLTPMAIKYIEQNFVKFCYALSVMAKTRNEFDKLVAEMPDVVIGASGAELIEGTYDQNKLNPLSSGLIDIIGGFRNPIYHISIAIAEWQARRFKRNQETLRVLKMRMLELETLSNKESNPVLSKDIATTQDRINQLEYEMRDLEGTL